MKPDKAKRKAATQCRSSRTGFSWLVEENYLQSHQRLSLTSMKMLDPETMVIVEGIPGSQSYVGNRILVNLQY